jgi:DNA-binding CsgD family transcriptional regulator
VNSESSPYRSIFVGRDAELHQLQSAYDAAAEGRPALVALAGEPGIGKTALCTQLTRYVAGHGGRAVWGHCSEADSLSLAYLPVVQALEAYVSSVDTAQLEADLGSTANLLARIVPRIRQRLGVQVDVSTADPDEDRWHLFQAVLGLLRSGAIRQPMLLVLEDLHEADRGTLDLLVHIARQIGDTRLLLVGTYRDVEVDRTHPLSSTLAELRRFPCFTRLGLRGLSVAEVHNFYCQLRGQDVPLSRAETVHQQTEGNPLFVQEYLRYLVEVGLVVERGGSYVPRDVSLVEAEVPEGLRDIVGKRLSQFSDRTNEVLHIAAVIGQEFRLDTLQRIAGLSEDVLFEALEDAHARAIIDESSGFGASMSFRFTHAFFRQTLYEEIFAPRRIRWHRLIGTVLEELYSDRLEEHAGELAAHYAHSSDPADLARAIAYDELAAAQAMRVYAYGEAARHLERALEVESVLDVREPLKRCDLLLAMGEAILCMEQVTPAVTGIATEAFDLAEQMSDPRRAARATVLALDALSRPWPGVLANTPEVREWVQRADRYAPNDSTERVYADVWLGLLAIGSGRIADVTVPLLRAVDLARRLGDDVAYAAAAGYALTHVAELSQVDVVAQMALDFLSHSHAHMRLADVAHALTGAGRLVLGTGERDAAERAWDELDQLSTRSHESIVRLQALPNRGIRALLDGDLEVAAAELEAESQFGQSVGRPTERMFLRLASIRSLHYLGRLDDALLGEFTGNIRPAMAIRAFVRSLLGRCDEVIALCARFSGIERHDDATASFFMALLLEASTNCRDATMAGVLAERMAPLAGRVDGFSLVSYGRLLGKAALLVGRDATEARDAYEKALAICERIRFRPELALVRLELAELLLNWFPSEREAAIEHVRLASAEFEAMHMQPSLDRALELARSTAPAGPPGTTLPESPDPLTEREREVASLLARGCSNREIANTLVISENTAEVHVKHILSKLGLKSRSQVAAWAARRDLPV